MVSASVVYRSREKPWNSESVVFSSTRSVTPGDHPRPRRRRSVTTAVRVSAAGPGERVRTEPAPAVLLNGHPGPRDGRLGVDEVPGQPQPELLDLVDARAARAKAYTVFFCVSVGSTLALSPVRWVAARSPASATLTLRSDQRRARRRRGAPGPAGSRPCRTGWVRARSPCSAPSVGGVAVRAQQQRNVVVPVRLGDEEDHGHLREERRAGRRCRRPAGNVPACH